MEIDQRHCPHCKHEVLDWGLPCPGCSLVPRQTEEGKKLLAEHRGRWLTTDWLFLALIVAVGYFFVLVFVAGRGKKDALPAPAPTAVRLQNQAPSPSH